VTRPPSTRPVLLEELAWPRVAGLVADGESLCLLPVGAIEQHGRHLPLVTDSQIATSLCSAVSARTGVPLLPSLDVTSSQAHTTRWPGTLALAPRTFIEVVVQLSTWVRAAGFRKLLIVNAHGGNRGPLLVATDEIRCQGDLQIGAIDYFELTPEILARFTADGDDIHANAAETSLMLHLRPELVDISEVRDDPDRTAGRVFRYTVAQSSRDGLTGSPSLASADAGAELFALLVDALSDRVERGRAESPPALS
jgi:creatinine amidohydrolase